LLQIVAGLGNSLKGHFSNKQHGSTLLEHGKNALTALSEVASDILSKWSIMACPRFSWFSTFNVNIVVL